MFSRVPGFCWTKLLAPDWLVPAVCALGAYPHSRDVAALSAWFREDPAVASFSLTRSRPRKRAEVAHVTGGLTPSPVPIYDRLRAADCLLGSRRTPEPRFPRVPSYISDARDGRTHRDRPGPSGVARPPPRGPPPIQYGVSNPRRPAQPGPTRRGPSPGAPPAPRPPARRAPSPAPYQPYPKVNRPPPRNPDYTPQVWQKANRDSFNIVIDKLRDSLKEINRVIADSVWQDFLSWLSALTATPDFN